MGFPGKHDCDDFRSLVVTGIVRRVLMADDATVNGLSVPPIPEAAQWRMLKCGPLAAADSRIDVTGQYLNDPRLLDYAIDLAATSGDYGILVCFQESMGRFPTVIEAARASWIGRKRADPVNHFAESGFCTENYTRDLEAIEISVYEEVKFATHALASSRVSRGPSGSGVVTRPSQPLHRSLRASSTSSPLRISSPSASRPCPSATPGPPESEAADVAVTPPRLPGCPHSRYSRWTSSTKREIGGGRLSVADNRATPETAFDEVPAACRTAQPEAASDGCLVAPMIMGGVETIPVSRATPCSGRAPCWGSVASSSRPLRS